MTFRYHWFPLLPGQPRPELSFDRSPSHKASEIPHTDQRLHRRRGSSRILATAQTDGDFDFYYPTLGSSLYRSRHRKLMLPAPAALLNAAGRTIPPAVDGRLPLFSFDLGPFYRPPLAHTSVHLLPRLAEVGTRSVLFRPLSATALLYMIHGLHARSHFGPISDVRGRRLTNPAARLSLRSSRPRPPVSRPPQPQLWSNLVLNHLQLPAQNPALALRATALLRRWPLSAPSLLRSYLRTSLLFLNPPRPREILLPPRWPDFGLFIRPVTLRFYPFELCVRRR